MRFRQARALLSLASLAAAFCVPASAQECCNPDSPFREGEGWADEPATCETISRWIDHAPKTNVRITLAIEGTLSDVRWDGALAYLILCEEPGVQVMCVTYQTNDMKPGDVVSVAGGYQRAGPEQVILDPCLAAAE